MRCARSRTSSSRSADGTKLAARIWLPVDAETHPVPAILEYLPYRKRDGTAPRDAETHPFFAGHGYASVRVDIRGTGESDGVLLDEYLKLEQDDCLEVLEWLEAQPWCTGACGMIGISWGGFNGLQVAARRPKQLKAVISLCSTDDRYADDVHYMGGCLLVDNFAWGSTMFTLQSYAPDPALVGERWREMWRERLENHPLLVDNWLQHQRRDAYWKHGSVIENYGDITAAVYAVGGWADGYSNAVPRLLAGLNCPKKGLVGPWAHRYPHRVHPGPAIGFLRECLRWWDQWLKGEETGIMAEPAYRVWMEEWAPPASYRAEQPGRWVAEPAWPSQNIKTMPMAFNAGSLGPSHEDEAALPIRSPLGVGLLGRPLVRLWPGAGPALGSARGGCPLRRLRHGAAGGDAGDPGRARGRAGAFRRPAPGPDLRPPQRCRARRGVAARQLRPAEPDPSRQP